MYIYQIQGGHGMVIAILLGQYYSNIYPLYPQIPCLPPKFGIHYKNSPAVHKIIPSYYAPGNSHSIY